MSFSIQSMFDQIAGRYDFLNHFLSAGRDIAWRKKAVKFLNGRPPGKVLDLCGGTGDFLQSLKDKKGGASILLVGDFSTKMLQQARKKYRFPCAQLDALHLPLRAGSLDTVLCGFGMRNLDSLEKGVESITSALGEGGVFVTLEFFKAEGHLAKFFYRILAPLFVPLLGGLISGKKSAYHYLLKSIKGFCTVQGYADLLRSKGFRHVEIAACDFGISHIVVAEK